MQCTEHSMTYQINHVSVVGMGQDASWQIWVIQYILS